MGCSLSWPRCQRSLKAAAHACASLSVTVRSMTPLAGLVPAAAAEAARRGSSSALKAFICSKASSSTDGTLQRGSQVACALPRPFHLTSQRSAGPGCSLLARTSSATCSVSLASGWATNWPSRRCLPSFALSNVRDEEGAAHALDKNEEDNAELANPTSISVLSASPNASSIVGSSATRLVSM